MTNDESQMTEYFYVTLRQSVKVALPVENSTEVISLTRGEICPIPGVTPELLGVVNQRGRLLWVLDLSDLLRLAPPPVGLRPQDRLTLVVMNAKSANSLDINKPAPQFGCVVSNLKAIVPLNKAEFKPVPAKLPANIRSFLLGVAEIEQSRIAVLNVNTIFSSLHASVTMNA